MKEAAQKFAKSFFSQFDKIKKRERIIILVIFAVCFILGAFISSAYNLQKYKKTAKKVVLKENAILSLKSEKKEVSQNETIPIVLSLTSNEYGIEAADFILNFDQNYLTAENITTGDFFKQYPIQDIKENTIKISAVAFFENNKLVIPKGKGIVATVFFKALQVGKTTVKVDPVNTIVASNGQNILDKKRLQDLAISIN